MKTQNSKRINAISKTMAVETDHTEMVDEAVPHLDELQNRLAKANSYAYEILRRAERAVDRVFAHPRDDEEASDGGDPIHMGMVETLGWEITFLMDKLRLIDDEVRRLGEL